MLGILYFILSFYVGYNILKQFIPYAFRVSNTKSLSGDSIKLSNWMVTIPGGFIVGILSMTWLTYLGAVLFCKISNFKTPLLLGNILSFAVFIFLAIYYFNTNKKAFSKLVHKIKNTSILENIVFFIKTNFVELIYITIWFAIWSYFMFESFGFKNNALLVGDAVFSDFGPHLAMIRSFSYGSNFPTDYAHFANGSVRYHFMFQFLTGNLEFLGLRLDYAFNLASIFSLILFLMLLYSLAVILTGKRTVGIITSLLFFFRSAWAFVEYYQKCGSLKVAINKLKTNIELIGSTNHENWGLWCQKVYANQRHLAFSLGILVFVLIIIMPLFTKMLERLKTIPEDLEISKFKYLLNEFALNGDGWLPEDLNRSIFIGVILGLSGFFNGAVLLASMPILCVIGIMAKHRLEFLNIAVISLLIFFIEVLCFIGPGASTSDAKMFIGFLADSRDLHGILKYYWLLLGIMPFILITSMFFVPRGLRWLTLAFFAPFVMANTLQLTPDITVNHKYIMLSVILLNIPIAYLLCRLLIAKKLAIITRTIAIVIIFVMTATGIVDMFTLNNLDKNRRECSEDDPTQVWVRNNTDPHDIFLTAWYCIHPILLAGRKIFCGWPYFTWSAGYDVGYRDDIARKIYGGKNPDQVSSLLAENNIRYVVIDNDNRENKEIPLNESIIADNFKCVFGTPRTGLAIYSAIDRIQGGLTK